MRIGDVLFKTVEKNAIMPSTEVDEIRDQYKVWLKEEATKTRVGQFIVTQQEKWYWRLALAFFYVFFQRWIWDFLHPEEADDDDDDDDDDRK